MKTPCPRRWALGRRSGLAGGGGPAAAEVCDGLVVVRRAAAVPAAGPRSTKHEEQRRRRPARARPTSAAEQARPSRRGASGEGRPASARRSGSRPSSPASPLACSTTGAGGGRRGAPGPARKSRTCAIDQRRDGSLTMVRVEQRGHPAGVGQPRGLLVDDAVEPAEHVVAHVVRRPAGQHVEQRGAQRPHVRGLVAALRRRRPPGRGRPATRSPGRSGSARGRWRSGRCRSR